jgi:hypothetical protein
MKSFFKAILVLSFFLAVSYFLHPSGIYPLVVDFSSHYSSYSSLIDGTRDPLKVAGGFTEIANNDIYQNAFNAFSPYALFSPWILVSKMATCKDLCLEPLVYGPVLFVGLLILIFLLSALFVNIDLGNTRKTKIFLLILFFAWASNIIFGAIQINSEFLQPQLAFNRDLGKLRGLSLSTPLPSSVESNDLRSSSYNYSGGFSSSAVENSKSSLYFQSQYGGPSNAIYFFDSSQQESSILLDMCNIGLFVNDHRNSLRLSQVLNSNTNQFLDCTASTGKSKFVGFLDKEKTIGFATSFNKGDIPRIREYIKFYKSVEEEELEGTLFEN